MYKIASVSVYYAKLDARTKLVACVTLCRFALHASSRVAQNEMSSLAVENFLSQRGETTI